MNEVEAVFKTPKWQLCRLNERRNQVKSFDPRIFTLSATEDSQPHLLGSICSACGAVFFPKQSLCTGCLQEGTLKDHALSTEGKVYSFTIVERESLAPKGFQVPYAYGYVDLPDRVRVLSKIVGWTPETLKLDSPVELVMEPLREDATGEKVMAFRFRIC
jgi:uncharacterized OB-fold protein